MNIPEDPDVVIRRADRMSVHATIGAYLPTEKRLANAAKLQQRQVPPNGHVTLDGEQLHDYETPDIATLPVLGRDGLIMEGGTNLLYSYPKVGKTELLTQMAAEWTSGGLTVLYLTEEPFGNWKIRCGIHDCWNRTLRLHYSWGYQINDALTAIGEETYDVLIVDTLRTTLGYLEGKGDEDVARVLVPLFSIAAGHTIVCAYHARKMPGEGGRDISGHHALYGAFDRALQLTPVNGRDDQRRVTVSGRCMYDGDVTVQYQQVEPGLFQVLDATAITEAKNHELQCLECGEWFRSRRKDARTCSRSCRNRRHRREGNGHEKFTLSGETDNF